MPVYQTTVAVPGGVAAYPASPAMPVGREPEPYNFAKQLGSGLESGVGAVQGIAAKSFNILDSLAEHLSNTTGIPKPRLFEGLTDFWKQQEEQSQREAARLAGGRQDFWSQLTRAPAAAIPMLPLYLAGGAAAEGLAVPGVLGSTAASMGMIGAIENSDRGWRAILQGAADGTLMGKFLDVMGPMKRPIRLAGVGLVTYAKLRLQGADNDTALANAMTNMGLSWGDHQQQGEVDTKAIRRSRLDRFRIANQLNPIEQASQDYINKLGIKTPLSMQTGSEAAQQLEASVRKSPGGGAFGRTLEESKAQLVQHGQEQELPRIYPQPVSAEEAGAAVGGKLKSDLEQTRKTLTEQVSPQPTTPELAGQQVIEKGKQTIQGLDREANQAYKAAWQAEKDPRNIREIPVLDENGDVKLDEDGKPVKEKMPLPIDMQDVQDALKPIVRRYEYTLSETDARASLGLKTMRQIIAGPRYKPVSAAELDLSMLKDAARTEKGLAELRDPSQGMAAFSVGKLQSAIDDAMANAAYPGHEPFSGPNPALTNLQAGRAATAKKYGIADVFSNFGRQNINELEPVGVFGRLTWGRDAGINQLRQVAEIAPDQMPAVGRAFIDGGGKWSELGPETKKILFRDPKLIEDLDQYHRDLAQFGPLTKLEPVDLFKRLTRPEGRTLNQLRAVSEQAPEEMPKLGRAFVEGLLDRVTREGDVEKVKSTLGKWLDLDAKSKALMFEDPALIHDIDKFFFSLKRMAANPNPSGSGFLVGLNQLKGRLMTGAGVLAGGITGGLVGPKEASLGAGLGILGGVGMEIGSNAWLARKLFDPNFIRMVTRGIDMQNRGDVEGARLMGAQVAKDFPGDEGGAPPTAGGPPPGAPPTAGGGGAAAAPAAEEAPVGAPAAAAGAAPPTGTITEPQHFEIQKLAENQLGEETYGAPEGWRDKLNTAADNAQKRIDKFWKDQSTTTNMRIPVDVLANYSVVGARKIVDGAETFGDWSKAMLDAVPQIQPHLRAVWKEAQHIAGMVGWGKGGDAEMPLGKRLTVPAGPVDEAAPKIAQNTVLPLVQKHLDNLDVWHQRNPNMFTSTGNYIKGMNELFQYKNGRVPVPPDNLIAYSTDGPALGQSIDEVLARQRKLAEEGLRESLKVRKLYADGTMKPNDTALYFAWGALSPRQSPYPQEAGFLHALDAGLDYWVDKTVAGRFTEKDVPAYLEWSSAALKGTPGAQATSNLNAFARRVTPSGEISPGFLINAGLPVEYGPYKGMRTIDALHEIIADPNLSSIEARRRFQQINNGLGIDNKVFSFVLLVTGHHDTLVADRVRINDFWNAPELEKQGLAYTTNKQGEREPTRNLYDNGLDDPWNGITGLGMYEAAEKALADRVKKAYADRGIKDGTLGRWHWETWVSKSGQEVSHGSLGAIPKMAAGMTSPQAAVGSSVRQGKYNDLSYGVRYERTPEGFRYNWPKSDESTVALTPEQHTKLLETLRQMRDKPTAPGYTEKERAIQRGTKTSEAKDAPWRELPGVNKAALDRLIERLSRR